MDPADFLVLYRVLQKIAQQVDERLEFIGNWLYCLRNAAKHDQRVVQPKRRTDKELDPGQPPKKANRGRFSNRGTRSNAAGPSEYEPAGPSQSASAGDQDIGFLTTQNLGSDLRMVPLVDSSLIQSWALGVDHQASEFKDALLICTSSGNLTSLMLRRKRLAYGHPTLYSHASRHEFLFAADTHVARLTASSCTEFCIELTSTRLPKPSCAAASMSKIPTTGAAQLHLSLGGVRVCVGSGYVTIAAKLRAREKGTWKV